MTLRDGWGILYGGINPAVSALKMQADTLKRLQAETVAELAAWNFVLLNYDWFAGYARNSGDEGRGNFRFHRRNFFGGSVGLGG